VSGCRLTRATALAGYFGLLGWLVLWFTVLAPPADTPVVLPLVFYVGLLLFALRGVLHGRPYTHAWLSLLSLLYFTHGIMEAWNNDVERGYALTEVAFSLVLFTGCVFFTRCRMREIKKVAGGE